MVALICISTALDAAILAALVQVICKMKEIPQKTDCDAPKYADGPDRLFCEWMYGGDGK